MDNVRTIMDMTKESLGCQVNNENDKNLYTLVAALCLVFSLILINCNARGMLVISFVRRSSHVTLINLDNKYPGSSFMLLFCKFSFLIRLK
jgi:hypothetical protein